MDTDDIIVLDVREQSEYDSGHIPGAVLLPVGTIDKNTAASALAELAYTNLYKFGGINTWPYGTQS